MKLFAVSAPAQLTFFTHRPGRPVGVLPGSESAPSPAAGEDVEG